MPTVKFDVSQSDPDRAKGFVPPTPGVYGAIIRECKPGYKADGNGKPDKDAPRLEIVVEITQSKNKQFKGARLFDYISFSEAAQWKMDQFLQVLGIATIKKRKGQFKTEDVVGMPVKIRVRGDTFNGEYSAKIGSYLEAEDEDILDDTEEDEYDEDFSADEGDEDEDEEGDEDEDEEESEEDEDEEESEEEGYTEADLTAMDLNGLNEILTEYGEEKPKGIKGKANKVARILELQPEYYAAEEEPEAEGDDYDAMDRAALVTEMKNRQLRVLKKDDEDALREKLRSDDNVDPFE